MQSTHVLLRPSGHPRPGGAHFQLSLPGTAAERSPPSSSQQSGQARPRGTQEFKKGTSSVSPVADYLARLISSLVNSTKVRPREVAKYPPVEGTICKIQYMGRDTQIMYATSSFTDTPSV